MDGAACGGEAAATSMDVTSAGFRVLGDFVGGGVMTALVGDCTLCSLSLRALVVGGGGTISVIDPEDASETLRTASLVMVENVW